jgi:Arc/MetJ-type ribon-helix-helix transcriptional regulator
MNVNLPASIASFVEEQVANLGFQSAAAYVSDLIEADRRRSARAYYEAEVLKGIQSGPSAPLDEAEWQSIREEILARHRESNQLTPSKAMFDLIRPA